MITAQTVSFFARRIISVLVVLAVHCSVAAAASSTIEFKDTTGVPRNITDVETAGDVQFSVVDQSGLPANGAEITLTNEITGEVISVVAANGIATFSGLAHGVWVVASSTSAITFTAVTVSAATAVAGAFGGTAVLGMSVTSAAAAGVGAAAAIAGGTIAISNAQDDDDDEDEPALSPFL